MDGKKGGASSSGKGGQSGTTSNVPANIASSQVLPPLPSATTSMDIERLGEDPHRAQSYYNPVSTAAPKSDRPVVFQRIAEHIVPTVSEPANGFMLQYLSRISEDICAFCHGRGHFPNNCASKRNVDQLMRETGNSEYWAKVKQAKLSEKFLTKRKAKDEFLSRN